MTDAEKLLNGNPAPGIPPAETAEENGLKRPNTSGRFSQQIRKLRKFNAKGLPEVSPKHFQQSCRDGNKGCHLRTLFINAIEDA